MSKEGRGRLAARARDPNLDHACRTGQDVQAVLGAVGQDEPVGDPGLGRLVEGAAALEGSRAARPDRDVTRDEVAVAQPAQQGSHLAGCRCGASDQVGLDHVSVPPEKAAGEPVHRPAGAES